jgi:hypothetical protein
LIVVERWHRVKKSASGAAVQHRRDLAFNRMVALDLPDVRCFSLSPHDGQVSVTRRCLSDAWRL